MDLGGSGWRIGTPRCAPKFEVVEFGKDRADWERREADFKPHYDSQEYKAWVKKRDAVAEVIPTRTEVRNEAMSFTAPEDEEQTAYLGRPPHFGGYAF